MQDQLKKINHILDLLYSKESNYSIQLNRLDSYIIKQKI